MQQKIEQPNESDMERIATLLAYSGKLSVDIVGEDLDTSMEDLPRLQSISETLMNLAEPEQDQQRFAFQALGMSFGQVLASQDRNYDWWMVNDSDGRDPCLRYQESELLVFPQTLLSRRVEDGESFDVSALYQQITNQLGDVTNE